MKWLQILCIGLALTLTGCVTQYKESSTPSEVWLVKCPKIPGIAPVDFGQTTEMLSLSLSMYFECANRHNSWVDYEKQRKK